MQPPVACGRKVTAQCSSGCRTVAGKQGWLQANRGGLAAGKQGWLQANRGGCRQTGVAAGKQGWLGCRQTGVAAGKQGWLQANRGGLAAGKQGWLQANRGGCRQTGVAAGKQGWLPKLSLTRSTGLLQTIIPPSLVHLKLSFHSYLFSSFLLIVLKLYFTFTGCPETTLPLLLVVLKLFVCFYWSP